MYPHKIRTELKRDVKHRRKKNHTEQIENYSGCLFTKTTKNFLLFTWLVKSSNQK